MIGRVSRASWSSMDSRFGSADAAIPPQVLVLAHGCPVRVVWENGVGGVTCEYGRGDTRRFVKWSPPDGVDLAAEAMRLDWAGQYVRVPVVVDVGSDSGGCWMVTLPVIGDNAVTKRWIADPATATRAIGEGLRALHEALPVASCPFSWSATGRVAEAHRRAGSAQIDRRTWDETHRPVDVPAALAIVSAIPDVDQLVVCHGDACAPNTLIDDSGRWSGHVDFGSMGVADRWADLAVATLSATWNYGPEWEQPVLDAYGIEPDPRRSQYYRLLWDLDP
jgi:aminoglycoside phosphotransferase